MKPGPASTDEVDHTAHGGWVFPALLAAVLMVSAVVALSGRPAGAPPTVGAGPTWTPSVRPVGKTVSLEIDFGNGARKVFSTMPWSEGMTVADLLAEAKKFRPSIDYSQQGTGAGGFLTALDGLRNEGAAGRNWRYKVDDKNGEVSFALAQLAPGARVLWEFSDEQ